MKKKKINDFSKSLRKPRKEWRKNTLMSWIILSNQAKLMNMFKSSLTMMKLLLNNLRTNQGTIRSSKLKMKI